MTNQKKKQDFKNKPVDRLVNYILRLILKQCKKVQFKFYQAKKDSLVGAKDLSETPVRTAALRGKQSRSIHQLVSEFFPSAVITDRSVLKVVLT